MYYVYILKSANKNKYYKGLTHNLDSRFAQHASGKNKYTKSILPVVLVHVELCNDRIQARKIEKFFKSGYGREVISEISENLTK